MPVKIHSLSKKINNMKFYFTEIWEASAHIHNFEVKLANTLNNNMQKEHPSK